VHQNQYEYGCTPGCAQESIKIGVLNSVMNQNQYEYGCTPGYAQESIKIVGLLFTPICMPE